MAVHQVGVEQKKRSAPGRYMKTADRISAGILLAVCAYFQIKLVKYNPLSKLFPQVIVIILAGLAVLLFIMSFVKKETVESIFGEGKKLVRPLISVVLMIGWVASIRLIGFLFSSIIFFPVTAVLITPEATEKRRFRVFRNIFIGLALIGVFYLLFSLVLNVQFPTGRLELI